MARVVRDRRSWWVVLGLAAVAGVVVPLMVFGSGEASFSVTPYADVIRFEVRGVASLQVQIFDLSGRKLWDSGVVLGSIVDWKRTNEWGERLAYGSYAYVVQGWSAQGALMFQKSGKLALLPGDKVQLQQAPPAEPAPPSTSLEVGQSTLTPMWDAPGNFTIGGNLGVGTETPGFSIDIRKYVSASMGFQLWETKGNKIWRFEVIGPDVAGRAGNFEITELGVANQFVIRPGGTTLLAPSGGNVGIGTPSPAGKVDIRNTTSQPALRIEASSGTNLIEAYNTGSGSATGLVFRVERETGNVRADGAFYGAGFYTGSADVAEHINVSEPVEPGDVVEIDPQNPGHFRKARTPGSRLVAGVISTDPGMVLGSNSDPVEGEGDPRPMLALAGRVPVKATAENGPIQVGDLLIASSKPGYAMRASDPTSVVGAVIGKALEPLEEGEGLIVMQVTLR